MYRKKLEENRIGYSLGIIVALCASLYVIFNLLDGWEKYVESNKRLEASVQEINQLQGQYDVLQKEKSHASSTTGIEMQIRSKFDVMKPEENAVFIISEEEEIPVPEEKRMQKIFNSFKRIFN